MDGSPRVHGLVRTCRAELRGFLVTACSVVLLLVSGAVTILDWHVAVAALLLVTPMLECCVGRVAEYLVCLVSIELQSIAMTERRQNEPHGSCTAATTTDSATITVSSASSSNLSAEVSPRTCCVKNGSTNVSNYNATALANFADETEAASSSVVSGGVLSNSSFSEREGHPCILVHPPPMLDSARSDTGSQDGEEDSSFEEGSKTTPAQSSSRIVKSQGGCDASDVTKTEMVLLCPTTPSPRGERDSGASRGQLMAGTGSSTEAQRPSTSRFKTSADDTAQEKESDVPAEDAALQLSPLLKPRLSNKSRWGGKAVSSVARLDRTNTGTSRSFSDLRTRTSSRHSLKALEVDAIAKWWTDIAAGIGPEEVEVLVVDDSKVDRLVARKALSSSGFQINFACSGDEAIELLEARCDESQALPSIVLMDINMP
eukprot:scaffold28823_cov38-Prasinocladus_malaysianus.AAC.1